MAVSIDLLDFYRALFERSCDAISAIAGALHTFYTRRGFVLLTKQVSCPTLMLHCLKRIFQGVPIKDAFRRGIGHAVQWYDSARVRMEKEVDSAVETASNAIEVRSTAL
jgi:hypothetical protein